MDEIKNSSCSVVPHLDVSGSLQVAGDVDIQGAVVLRDLLLQVNVCVLDHLKRAVVRKE